MIRNLTGETVRVCTAGTLAALDAGGVTEDSELVVIEPDPHPARLTTVDLGDIGVAQADDEDLPLALVECCHLDGLPDRQDGTYLIVTLPVALAARGRSDLLIPHAELHHPDGRLLGHRQLASPC